MWYLFVLVVAHTVAASHHQNKKPWTHRDSNALETAATKLHRNCNHCLPGFGVVQLCNNTHATVCAPCADGFYSPKNLHLRPCRLCSKCGDGLYVDRRCSPVHDTLCDACSNNRNSNFNEDFVLKCRSLVDSPQKHLLGNSKSNEEQYQDLESMAMTAEDELGLFNDADFETTKTNSKLQSLASSSTKDRLKLAAEELLQRSRNIIEAAADAKESSSSNGKVVEQNAEASDQKLDSHHYKTWDGEQTVRHADVKLKPSFHGYAVEELIRAQRRKVYILAGVSAIVLCSVFAVLVCFVKLHCERRYKGYRRFCSTLSEHEKALIQESVRRLEAQQSKSPSRTGYYLSSKAPASASLLRVYENPIARFGEMEPELGDPEPVLASDKRELLEKQEKAVVTC